MTKPSSITSTEAKKSYAEKLKDPRWQRKRLEILNRDEWSCCICGESEETLHVHHRVYCEGKEPWEYDDDKLETLCELCHGHEHSALKDYMSTLKYSLGSRGFHADDVFTLAETIGLKMEETPYIPEVVMDAICWKLSGEGKLTEIIKEYFEYLAKKRELKESSRG